MIFARQPKTTLSVMMFLQYATWGAWYVTLNSYLGKTLQFEGTAIGLIYGAFALAAMISPLIVTFLTDKLYSAEKVLGLLHLSGAILLILLPQQDSVARFYTFTLLYALCYMPTIALTNMIAMRHLKDADNSFSKIRVFGTIGWIAIGWLITLFNLELSSTPILIGAGISMALGIFSFSLPSNPPLKAENKTSGNFWNGLRLLKDRQFAIIIIVSLLISIPLSFYYSFTNLFLNDIEIKNAAGIMTLGQGSEVVFMLILPLFFRRLGVKNMILIAICAWVLRYLLFAFGYNEVAFIYIGIALHGICYDFFFVTGQLYVNKKSSPQNRSVAQGILTQATYGIGMFIGSWISGIVVDSYTINQSHDWKSIWLAPALFAGVIGFLFLISFRESTKANTYES